MVSTCKYLFPNCRNLCKPLQRRSSQIKTKTSHRRPKQTTIASMPQRDTVSFPALPTPSQQILQQNSYTVGLCRVSTQEEGRGRKGKTQMTPRGQTRMSQVTRRHERVRKQDGVRARSLDIGLLLAIRFDGTVLVINIHELRTVCLA